MCKMIALLFVLLCSSPAWSGQLQVVTTTEDLRSIVEEIGGDLVHAESLGKGTQNYHFLAAKPSYMVQARKADLFVISGLDLEAGYAGLVLEGSRNPRIQKGQLGFLDASQGIDPLDIPERVDRSMGDIHSFGNPHYWLDPENAKIIASSVAGRLSAISPENSGLFRDNLALFHRKIDEKIAQWQEILSPYKGEKLVSYHSSWNYFAERFGFEVVGELEPKPGVPPGPAHLRKIVDLIRAQKVRVLLHENVYSSDAGKFIAGSTEAKLIIVPISVGGTPQANDYFSLIDVIVDRLAKGFGA